MGIAKRLLSSALPKLVPHVVGADDADAIIRGIEDRLRNPGREFEAEIRSGNFLAQYANDVNGRCISVICRSGRSHIATLNFRPDLLPVQPGFSMSSVVAAGAVSWRALRPGRNRALGTQILILFFGVIPIGDRYGIRWIGTTSHTREALEWTDDSTLGLSANPASNWQFDIRFEDSDANARDRVANQPQTDRK